MFLASTHAGDIGRARTRDPRVKSKKNVEMNLSIADFAAVMLQAKRAKRIALIACALLTGGVVYSNPTSVVCSKPGGTANVSACWKSVSGTRSIQIEDLIGIADIGGSDTGLFISPAGDRIAFQVRQMQVSTNDHQITWLVVPFAGGRPTRLASGGELITAIDDDGTNNGNPAEPFGAWSPDGKWFAYLRKTNGEVQIWRVRLDELQEEQVTHSIGDVASFTWISDETIAFKIALESKYEATEMQQARDEGFVWDEAFWPRYAWLPRFQRNKDSSVWVVDARTHKVEKAQPRDAALFADKVTPTSLQLRPYARVVVRDRHRRSVASLEALDPSRRGDDPPLTVVVSKLPDGHSAAVCSAMECTGRIKQVWWSNESDRLYFLRKEGHSASLSSIYEWEIGSQKIRHIQTTPNWLGDDCVVVIHTAICMLEDLTTPRRLAAIDLKLGTITTIYDPNPKFSALSKPAIERLDWRDSFGNETMAHLVFPLEYQPGKRYPLAIVQYRSNGRFLRGGTGSEYPIEVFASQGFFVLSWDRPEFRDAATHLSMDDLTRFVFSHQRDQQSALSALESIIDYLSDRELIDPLRVGITGLSNGASNAYIGLIHSKRFATAALSQGSSDPLHYYLLSLNYRRGVQSLSGMPRPDNTDGAQSWWKYGSLALNVENIKAPIMLHISDSELGGAMQTVAALQDASKPFEAYVYPDEFHIKHQPRHLMKSMERTVDWFNFWLRNTEDSRTEKNVQYLRWRKMRSAMGKAANAE